MRHIVVFSLLGSLLALAAQSAADNPLPHGSVELTKLPCPLDVPNWRAPARWVDEYIPYGQVMVFEPNLLYAPNANGEYYGMEHWRGLCHVIQSLAACIDQGLSSDECAAHPANSPPGGIPDLCRSDTEGWRAPADWIEADGSRVVLFQATSLNPNAAGEFQGIEHAIVAC